MSMSEINFNLYNEANKRQIILTKDYVKIYKNKVYDLDGVLLDFIDVYHDEIDDKKVGYYIVQGYQSVRVHFNMNMGMYSLSKLFKKICFDIGFLNNDKDFNNVFAFCKLIDSYMFSKHPFKHKDDLISFLITKGMETDEDSYNHLKLRKYYFTDKDLTGEERKRIAIKSMNKNRRKTDRYKIEEAIEYFMEGNAYVSQKDIADFLNVSLSTVKMNMTPEDKRRIRDKNIEVTGCPTTNEYIRALNIDKIQQAYLKIKDKNQKITATELSKLSNVHRVTVSKILKEKEDIFDLS